ADADIPGVVARLRNAQRERTTERGRHRRAVEGVRGAQPLPAELAGDVQANAGGAKDGARRSVLGGDRGVVAPGAEVQEVRRVVLVEADRPVVVDGDVDLGVALKEARVLLGEVAVEGKAADAELAEVETLAERGAIVGGGSHSVLCAEALAT